MFLRVFSRKHGRIPKGSLERVNLREKSSRAPGRPSKYFIVTLDPNKFAEKKQQPFHIGNLQSFEPNVLLLKQLSPVISPRLKYGGSSGPRYPSGTKAFLYYSRSPEKPRIAGELRLRVTSNDDPGSFESGSDLAHINGRPWTRPLFSLIKLYFPLYEKLREERIIPDDLDAALSSLPSKIFNYGRTQLLYTLNDTFILDFGRKSHLFVINEQAVEMLVLVDIFFDARRLPRATPYTGHALARFERSTLPHHKDTRTVVLRFLKIITPVERVISDYDDYICCPKEGELYRRASRYSVSEKPEVWSVNIDVPQPKYCHTIQRGLQLLWGG